MPGPVAKFKGQIQRDRNVQSATLEGSFVLFGLLFRRRQAFKAL
jgi:hypothetical protein